MATPTARAIFITLQATSPRKCSILHFRGANLGHSLHFSFSLWIRQGRFCTWWCVRYNHSMSSFGVWGSCYLKTLRKLISIFSSRSTAWREEGSLLTDLYNLGGGVTHESKRARHLTRAPTTRGAKQWLCEHSRGDMCGRVPRIRAAFERRSYWRQTLDYKQMFILDGRRACRCRGRLGKRCLGRPSSTGKEGFAQCRVPWRAKNEDLELRTR